jgi:Phage integrase, N-terminal SAM-like domain
MIEDMTVRNFVEKTRTDYIRHVRTLTAFIGRAPDSATPEDLRRFQLHQTETGVRPPTINGAVAALRFFFSVTLDRPEMARHLTFVRDPRRILDPFPEGELCVGWTPLSCATGAAGPNLVSPGPMLCGQVPTANAGQWRRASRSCYGCLVF